MERLQAQDKGRREPLTEEQKAEIARLRQEAEAKLAEMEILHRDNVTSVAEDDAKVEEVKDHYQIDRRRVQSNLESSIERVRRAEQD